LGKFIRIRDIMYVLSAKEDLAFMSRPSRESDKVGWRCCIELDFTKWFELLPNTGTEVE
jgi:hypothetical protein